MKRTLNLGWVLCLAGCGTLTESDYQRPDLALPAWQQQDTGSEYLQHSGRWWQQFNDPTLSAIIEQALVANNDLLQAGLRLKQARIQHELTAGNLTPSVSAGGNAGNSKSLKADREPAENYSASLNVGYELDVWGKLARTRDQAQWEAEASAQDLQETARVLIGTTAQLYWQISQYNHQLEQLAQIQTLREETERLVRARYQAGNEAREGVLQAEQRVLDGANQIHHVQAEREKSRDALALLLGRPPSQPLPEGKPAADAAPVTVTLSAPLDIIAHRPDVQAAEWRLRAALAGSDAARLSFYPTLSLSAALNAGNALFRQWFDNPARTLGTTLSLPFLEWNKVQLTVENAQISVRQASLEFRNSVYRALSQVADAQAERQAAVQNLTFLQKSVTLNQQSADLTRSRYLAGAVPLSEWLAAQENLFTNHINLVDARIRYLNATLTLCLAMGYDGRDVLPDQAKGP
ncbi:efflux transporter outer membrane subunit [Nissabacter archeti]|uniref:efflux transporter outer membrane subunit n=1 Tax=Nissabacter archeti TaxID=1917880 RepID=UPI0009339E78|nr:efflux transporter outer membrane subunit [Nissabacter archeti]